MTGDPGQEYPADGLTDALIGRLAGIHDLKVISRTSVMRFKNPQMSVPQIAKTLGVDAIVEGSVMRQGNRLRVTAQLIRAATECNSRTRCGRNGIGRTRRPNRGALWS